MTKEKTMRCKDCICEQTCLSFNRCVMEPIPDDYVTRGPIGRSEAWLAKQRQDLSTGAVLGDMLADELSQT